LFFVTNLCLCVFSIVILLTVRLSCKRTDDSITFNSRLFASFIYTTGFLLIMDLLSRFDGRAYAFYPILNQIGNFIVFLLNPVLPIMWILYVHNQVFCDDQRTLRFGRPFIIYAVINAVFTIISQFTGWYYYIDPANVYHRGVLFLVPAVISQVIMLATFALLIVNRKRFESNYYITLFFFGIPPVICVILQLFIFGIAFALNGIVISIIIMFINTQNRRMNIDYLTGVFNRKQIDYYIADKIRCCSDHKTFSAILLDLDNFKKINDSLGHNVGDDALKSVVSLLKSCIRSTDFIARFGGDEFFIIMDLSDDTMLLEVVDRIRERIYDFNCRGVKPYKISLSMGYMVYDARRRMSVEEFETQIDQLMYLNKTSNKSTVHQIALHGL
jgi:diguanylate cyclase (GGDEF)-like protein